ncbi:hypothetical protein PNH38_16385 [Anoxybacillus rupiensis]|jgi:hypothetical protein|uniref:Uncharacterized protein n=1 Tax=Anoxybacteroides rupiense TaxID=311460 RepID=A0ABD5ISK8_9BACL|nr:MULTISPECIES: hypothetical protein [Anoxybacillus]KXG09319.1 hypothetical protein AT864_02549 [Anoxybacillus sp. P3H1B]MBB3908172.1 hypothetical protein [Anoxybacillus rupiensis]MBS2772971.1 hypothetical protein [Anoxybacillus rupiensis]MDE8565427.1 hypothetical protein [Anoxybacillus rupiensis]MED5051273.1 hypothetical protein [Anoxybacillus rupiensis]
MNMLKVLFGKSEESKGCCDIQIVEVKETEKNLDKNKQMDRECCSPASSCESC